MKAIETHYKGYRFRSRLEARWAVFFDALGLEWEYEPEGFDLDGLWYLPDFFIQSLNLYIEIKGKKPAEDELEKCNKLRSKTGDAVWIIHGSPMNNWGYLFAWDLCDSGGGEWDGKAVVIFENGFGDHVVFCNDERVKRDRGIYFESCFNYEIKAFYFEELSPLVLAGQATGKAVYKSRSARFEHGECAA